MSQFRPMRQLPTTAPWKKGDVLVMFGELFARGYANGLVDEAKARGMTVIYSTVGRRDENLNLRPLNNDELQEKDSPLINIPLEAGFDLEPSSKGQSPVDQLQGVKLSDWDKAPVDLHQVEESKIKGIQSFRKRVEAYLLELRKMIPKGANVLFAHTMAGGVPRAKIIMPAMNRVFKGYGDRFASSEEFWKTPMGQLCSQSFMEVTAMTYHHLIDLSTPLRQEIENQGQHVAYVAYGYHGTDVLCDNQYRWQSYSPYLQGFAKKHLETISEDFTQKGIKTSVYNAPEILTNSSSIFLGVEVSLYPLLGALQKEGSGHQHVQNLIKDCLERLKPGTTVESLLRYTQDYFLSDTITQWSQFDQWPQHNGAAQMAAMRKASSDLIDLHADPKELITSILSEVVFKACGQIMLNQSWNPRQPVWWLGHDIIAKQVAQ